MQEKAKVNPLLSKMRQPKIYVRLPSQGQYYPEGSLDATINGEYPVFSMTAKDELMLKTPDALLNGQAVVSVLESCMPNILNGWEVPNIDVDALLIAIRLATYGENMDTTVKIGGEEATYTLDLRVLLDQLQSSISWEEKVQVSEDMTVYVRPLPYRALSKASIETFETQRIMNVVNDEKLEQEKKVEIFKESFNKLTEVTIGIIADSIYKIETAEGAVTETEYIKEFIENCDREIFNTVKDHLDMLKERNTLKPLRVKATQEMIEKGAGEEVDVPIVFDAANFFG